MQFGYSTIFGGKIIEAQKDDSLSKSIQAEIASREADEIAYGGLRYSGRLFAPEILELRNEVLRESHCSSYMIHLGGTKMYYDLRRQFWWNGTKKDVTIFVA